MSVSQTAVQTVRNALGDLRQSDGWAPPPELTGFSGKRLLELLWRVTVAKVRIEDSVYLEVGSYQGLTLLSTAHALREHGVEDGVVYGVENFSQFDKDGTNLSKLTERASALGLEGRYEILNDDYEVVLPRLGDLLNGRQVGVYFVDGPHDYRSQLMCLLLMLPHLAEEAVIVIDDCNYPHVRLATADFLAACPDFKLALEVYTPGHPLNASEASQATMREGWWNGAHVLVRDTKGDLPVLLPDFGHAKELQYDQHTVLGSVFGPRLDVMVRHASALYPLNLSSARRFYRFAASSLRQAKENPGHDLYLTGNTHSKDLPSERINPGLDRDTPSC